MKTIIFVLIAVSLAVGQTGLRKDRELLVDFRNDNDSTPFKITAATQRTVLSKVFRRYLTDANQCKVDFDAEVLPGQGRLKLHTSSRLASVTLHTPTTSAPSVSQSFRANSSSPTSMQIL
jgi:hypothetical protein